jgi:hypothetical protein
MRTNPSSLRRLVASSLMLILASTCLPLTTRAQPAEPQPQVWQMQVSPAAAPVPALRYRLTPHPADEIEGNAAALYQMAILSLPAVDAQREELREQVNEMLGRSDAEFDSNAAQQVLSGFHATLSQVDLASRRTRAEWDLPIREQGISALLPHLNYMRQLANALMLRARAETAEGRFDEAVVSLRSGYMMARHLGDEMILIQGLVSVAIEGAANEQARRFISQTGSPNLYWALADLPQPLVNSRQSLRGERAWIYYTIPALVQARKGELAVEGWQQVGRDVGRMGDWMDPSTTADFTTQLAIAAMAARALPAARAHLLEQGYTPEQVDQMPVVQVVGMYQLYEYEYWMDELSKWWGLPFWQAWPRMRQASERIAQDQEKVHNPLMVLVPSLEGARVAFVRAERNRAALMTVEALRNHAAAHGGDLPDTLEQLELPAPVDPYHGRPFEYARTADGCILISEPREGIGARDGLRVELTVRNR